jgi:ubiquitin C-terminal hydrolase
MHIFGLDNIRYTCYLNATLQCLFAFQIFRDIVTVEPAANDGIVCALKDIVSSSDITSNKQRIRGLRLLIKTLIEQVPWFTFLQHNDVNEFIMLFFEQLNIELHKSKVFPLKHVKYDDTTIQGFFMNKAQKSWISFVKDEHTILNEIITGQLVNQVICGNCKKIHHNYETFRVLDIDIPEIDDINDLSVNTCLSKYFEKTIINEYEDDDHGDKWVCDKCNTSAKSLKTCKLVKLPDMLVISLKRFKYNEKVGKFLKNNAYVKVHNVLDIDEYSVCNEPSYKLMSFANHMGNMHGGHYTACCRYGDDSWFKIDDESISNMNNTYEDRNAYTIFYQKQLKSI